MLGQLPIPCLFKYTEVLLYYSFLILNFTISLHGVPVISKHWNRDSIPDYFFLVGEK